MEWIPFYYTVVLMDINSMKEKSKANNFALSGSWTKWAQRIGVVTLTTSTSNFSGYSSQHRHPGELPPTTAFSPCQHHQGILWVGDSGDW